MSRPSLPSGRAGLAAPAAGVAAAALLLAALSSGDRQAREVDSGQFRIRLDGRDAGTEVFAIRRTADAVRSAARLTAAGSESPLLEARTLEARLQTDSLGEPTLFELRSQGGPRLDLVAVRSGNRLQLRVRTDEGERLKEILARRRLVVLPRHLAHFHYFALRLVRGKSEAAGWALLPVKGSRVPLRVSRTGGDTVHVGGEARPAVRYRLEVGEARRHVWADSAGRVLRVEVPSAEWSAVRLPADESGTTTNSEPRSPTKP